MSAPRTAAIIQARVGSSRFPRKIFADIHGRPLLGRILDRLRACRSLDLIIIATSDQPGDGDVIAFAEAEDVAHFAGDENDVQRRYLDAAAKFGVDRIVRICGDSPFIDPEMVDRLVAELAAGADYAEPDPAVPGAYEGMEAVTIEALRKAREWGDDGPDREHVTWYIRHHVDRFRVAHPAPPEDSRGHWRLSIDCRADLDFVRSVFGILDEPGRAFGARELAAFLRENTDVALLNAHVSQKPADKVGRVLGVYVEDERDLSTALTLARRVTEEHHGGVRFVGPMSEWRQKHVEALGYPAFAITGLGDERLAEAAARWKLDALIVPDRCAAAAHAAVPVFTLSTNVDDIIRRLDGGT